MGEDEARQSESVTAAHEAVARALPRNLVATVAWEVIWGFGAPSIFFWAMVPSYLLFLGASKTFIQVVTLVMPLLTVLQLVSGRLTRGPRRKWRIFWIWITYCGVWLGFGMAGMMLGSTVPPGLWVAGLVGLSVVTISLTQLGTPPYVEMVMQNTPLRWRGRASAIRMIAVGSTGIVGALIANWLVSGYPVPTNYHMAFVVGGAVCVVSCLAILGIRDVGQPLAPVTAPGTRLSTVVRTLWGNYNFRIFLLFYGFAAAAMSLVPLIIGYGYDLAGIPQSWVARFTAGHYIGTVVLGGTLPFLADRWGFKLVAVISAGLQGAAFAILVVVGPSPWVVLLSYGMLMGGMSLGGTILSNLGAELCPDVAPSAIVAVCGVIVLPVTMVVSPLAGRLVDSHGEAGYLGAFMVGMTLSAVTALGYLLIVREPRSGHELVLRVRQS